MSLGKDGYYEARGRAVWETMAFCQQLVQLKRWQALRVFADADSMVFTDGRELKDEHKGLMEIPLDKFNEYARLIDTCMTCG